MAMKQVKQIQAILAKHGEPVSGRYVFQNCTVLCTVHDPLNKSGRSVAPLRKADLIDRVIEAQVRTCIWFVCSIV